MTLEALAAEKRLQLKEAQTLASDPALDPTFRQVQSGLAASYATEWSVLLILSLVERESNGDRGTVDFCRRAVGIA